MQSIHEVALEKARNFEKSETDLVDIISEVDRLKAFREKGFASTFEYCLKFLKLSESTTYNFISEARKAREIPELKQAIKDDKLTVSTARKILPVLNQESKDHRIGLAQNLPKAALEREVAKVKPETLTPEKVKYVSENRLQNLRTLCQGHHRLRH